MAKTSGPLLSFGARGQIGKTMVASKWRGVPYMRQHVIPSNPNTVAQQGVRKLFAFLREAWKTAPAEVLDVWNAFAQGRPFLGVNKWVGENVRVLNGDALMTDVIYSPGAKGGPAPATAVIATGGAAGEIDVDWTLPTAPNGWMIYGAAIAAIKDQDPTGIFEGPFFGASVAAPAITYTITGLTVATDYVVGLWLVWTKPDGSLAYSVSIVDTATSHA